MYQPLKTLQFWAKFGLVALLLNVMVYIGVFFQTEYQLITPLVPKHVIYDIARPFILCALLLTGVCTSCLILYFFHRYLLVFVLSMVAIFVGQVYLSFPV